MYIEAVGLQVVPAITDSICVLEDFWPAEAELDFKIQDPSVSLKALMEPKILTIGPKWIRRQLSDGLNTWRLPP